MKRIKKIIVAVLALFIVIFIAAYVFLLAKGKPILIKQLESITHKKVSVGYFSLAPLFNLEIRDLNIEGLAKAEYVSVSPSIILLLTGNIGFNRINIVKPEIYYERRPSEGIGLSGTAPALPEGQKKKKQPRLIIKHLNIKSGKVDFADYAVGGEGIKVTVRDINFSLSNLFIFPASVSTKFELSGKIPWHKDQEEGKISAAGWLNFLKGDMQANLRIEDIDGVYLYPYYSNWVDLEKARIEKAKLNFTSNITGQDNNVTADCHLELTDIVRRPRSAEEEIEKAERIADAVLDIFRAMNQGKIVLDFTIRTKMDRPEFGFSNIKSAFEDKLARARGGSGIKPEDVLRVPGKIIEGTVKGATDISRAVIEGVFAVGKEIKKGVEDSFKKKKKETEIVN